MKVENKTIIITDPCYLIPQSKLSDWDNCNYGEYMEVLGINNYECRNTIYGDWSCMVYEGELDKNMTYKEWDKLYFGFFKEYNKQTDQDKKALIYDNFVKQKQEFMDKNNVLGEFCADAGMVGVFELEEVLKYNPEFNYHEESPHTTTVIPNFTGEVNIEVIDDQVHVIGKGNINFFSVQSGL